MNTTNPIYNDSQVTVTLLHPLGWYSCRITRVSALSIMVSKYVSKLYLNTENHQLSEKKVKKNALQLFHMTYCRVGIR